MPTCASPSVPCSNQGSPGRGQSTASEEHPRSISSGGAAFSEREKEVEI